MDTHTQTCGWCQATARAAARLRFKKLGKHERRLLLLAAPHGDQPVEIMPPGGSQDDQTSTRRAVRSLRDLGLIAVSPHRVRITPDSEEARKRLRTLKRKYAVMRFFGRTALGEAVVEHYSRELRAGARIRWALRLDDVTVAAIGRCPHRD